MATNIIRKPQDVIDLINEKSSKASLFITLVALGGIMLDAYQAAMIGFGNAYIAAQFEISQGLAATVNASNIVAALIGGLLADKIINAVGQRKAFILGLGLCTLGAFIISQAQSIWIILFSRIIMGFGLGIDFPLATTAVSELQGSKNKKTGTSVNLWQMGWYIATSIVFLILLPLHLNEIADPSLWRYGIFIGGIFGIVIIALRFIFIGESAMWAARKGKFELAQEILLKRYNIESELDIDSTSSYEDNKKKTNEISTLSAYKVVLSPKYRKRTILGVVVATMQAWQYNAVGIYLPLTLGGILGNEMASTLTGSAIVNAIFGITGGAIGSLLVTKYGSRLLAMIGFFFVTSLLVILGSTTSLSPWFAIFFLGLIIFFHSAGPGGLGMTIATLSYPPSIRAAGIGFARAIMRCGAIAGLTAWPVIWGTFKTDAFFILAAVPFIGFITCLLIKWEAVGSNVDNEDEYVLNIINNENK